MNEHPAPLPSDLVDELLSAELDGDFDAAATDLGFEPDEARARLAASAGVDPRRQALAAARDALAEIPPIDELLAARLRAKAVQAAEAEASSRRSHAAAARGRRAMRVSGALAAALAVVVGVVAAVNAGGGGSSKQRSFAATPRSARNTTGAQTKTGADSSGGRAALDFGSAPDAGALARQVAGSWAAPATANDSEVVSSAPASSNFETQKDALTGAPIYAGGSVGCTTEAQSFSGLTQGPSRSGVATVAGSPVAVFVFQATTERVVLVLTSDCKLLNRTTIPLVEATTTP